MIQCCFVIPIYNHHETIRATVEQLLRFDMPILIIDDGSDISTKYALTGLVNDYPLSVRLFNLPKNLGKGAAVMFGFHQAVTAGLTHALQIDADGQHNHDDIPTFLAAANNSPLALISGWPQYDESMPLSRKIGRQITHFWVHVETLSFKVKDTMCGFRVYPLEATLATMETKTIGRRMDFDIELMVRMYWRQTPIIFIKTPVIYPKGGRSHFRPLEDNWRITKMHTRLFFGMLLRSPALIARKLKRN
ncbi:glycosyl transferase [Pseudidiomarina salinarum]|uniref:Glycosyl transferase n=1 Tax=Pseudidiomarina salinarum TaxID=435908 RepID=A0A094JE95_9GAMM|nr:glycosyltransferase family 2 protein [Pseudidiomarina salinarum]KFZ30856.1 glycosyl transferase [Pseudidiomarina salinarum]RUO71330.1 glycosyltransferase family 2 protein [Pseudidiomarina salinarum]